MEGKEETTTSFRLDSLRVVQGGRQAFISYESEGRMTMSGDDPNTGAVEMRIEGTEVASIQLDLERGLMVSHSSRTHGTTIYVVADRTVKMTMNVASRTTLLRHGH
jgi:hypothetical protein